MCLQQIVTNVDIAQGELGGIEHLLHLETEIQSFTLIKQSIVT